MFRLDNKVAIVTGASRGIGAAIAIGLAQAGAKILLVSRTEPQADVIAALENAQQPFLYFAADLGEMSSVAPTIDAALTAFGRVDILINNAGMTRRSKFIDMTEADLDVVMAVNLKVPVFLAQACAKQMLSQENGEGGEERCRGKIINICSLSSFQGNILVPAYTISKHALAGATKAMANELAQRRINVNGIAPGYIRTDLNVVVQTDPERSSGIVARIPHGRWGEPSDMAGAAVFLASAASDYLHGHILPVDGGWLSR